MFDKKRKDLERTIADAQSELDELERYAAWVSDFRSSTEKVFASLKKSGVLISAEQEDEPGYSLGYGWSMEVKTETDQKRVFDLWSEKLSKESVVSGDFSSGNTRGGKRFLFPGGFVAGLWLPPSFRKTTKKFVYLKLGDVEKPLFTKSQVENARLMSMDCVKAPARKKKKTKTAL